MDGVGRLVVFVRLGSRLGEWFVVLVLVWRGVFR